MVAGPVGVVGTGPDVTTTLARRADLAGGAAEAPRDGQQETERGQGQDPVHDGIHGELADLLPALGQNQRHRHAVSLLAEVRMPVGDVVDVSDGEAAPPYSAGASSITVVHHFCAQRCVQRVFRAGLPVDESVGKRWMKNCSRNPLWTKEIAA